MKIAKPIGWGLAIFDILRQSVNRGAMYGNSVQMSTATGLKFEDSQVRRLKDAIFDCLRQSINRWAMYGNSVQMSIAMGPKFEGCKIGRKGLATFGVLREGTAEQYHRHHR